ncbi:hypothetical protein [Nocardioides immobilis]|uniref:hypothetical protein n=1 Tax=Nocardioides immobilis TaxID=2049295 RepID=UPI0015FB8D7D|nr:hypothetical protein [Nocardioides immobilis]
MTHPGYESYESLAIEIVDRVATITTLSLQSIFRLNAEGHQPNCTSILGES